VTVYVFFCKMFFAGLQAQEGVHHYTDATVYDKDGLLVSC